MNSMAAAGDSVAVGVKMGAWHAIMSASLVVQLTLLTLLAMSVMSWAIIYNKHKLFKLVEDANRPFLDRFWKASSLDDIFDQLENHETSNLARIFKAGYLELRKLADSKLAKKAADDSAAPALSGLDNLQRALQKATDLEVSKLELRLSFLATTGSTGPFIGLFGTVWGIMGAFQKIGATKMASLAVVAPGISEALIATAIGLATAIPASVAYNLFVTKIRRQELDMSSFGADFLNIVKRNFFKDH